MKKIIVMNMLLEVFDEKNKLYFKSIVQEVNDASFAIGIPMAERKELTMPLNTIWTFRTTLKDALYYFDAEVMGHTTSGNVPLIQIAWPEKAERLQRRNYFRLSTFLDLYFWVLEKDGLYLDPGFQNNGLVDNLGEPEKFGAATVLFLVLSMLVDNLGEPEKAIALDISGGGILMVSPHQLPRGATLLLQIFFHDTNITETVLVEGKIVREEVNTEAGMTRYCYGLCFENISEKLRERIVQYIFAITRERARKGG